MYVYLCLCACEEGQVIFSDLLIDCWRCAGPGAECDGQEIQIPHIQYHILLASMLHIYPYALPWGSVKYLKLFADER